MPETFLLKEEVKSLINNRPQNTNPRDVVKGLVDRGFQLQGLNANFSDSRKGTEFLPTSVQKTSEFGQGIIKQGIENVVDAGQVGESFLRGSLKTLLPKSLEEKFRLDQPSGAQTIKKSESFKKVIERDTKAEKSGASVEEALEFFLPVPGGKGAKLADKINDLKGVTKLGAKSLREAVDIGARGTLQEGEFNKDIAIASGIGALVPGANTALGKLVKPVKEIIEALPNRFIESALGRSKKLILNEMEKDSTKSLVNFLKNKPVKTAKNLLKDSNQAIESLGKQIANNLKSVSVTQNKITTKSLVSNLVKELNEDGASISAEEVSKIITKLSPQAKGLLQKPSMGLVKANQLRQSIDRTLGDNAFLGGQQTFNKEVLKNFNNKLRKEIQDKAPEGTKELYNQISLEIQLRDAMADKIAKKAGNQVLGFGDFIGGSVTGLAVGLMGNPLAGVALGVAGKRAIESTPFKIGASKSIEKTIKVIENLIPILEKLSPVERGSLMEAIEFFREE